MSEPQSAAVLSRDTTAADPASRPQLTDLHQRGVKRKAMTVSVEMRVPVCRPNVRHGSG